MTAITRTILLLIVAIAAVCASCTNGFLPCGRTCYNAKNHCCQNGQLVQIGLCSRTSAPPPPPPAPVPTTSSTTSTSKPSTSSTTKASTSSTSSTTRPSTSSTSSTYNPTPTSSPQNQCGSGLTACGQACYNPADNQYCCVNGALTQKAYCPQTPATSSSQATPATSKAAASTSSSTSSKSSTTSSTTRSSTSPKSTTSSTTSQAAATSFASPVTPPSPVPRPISNSGCTGCTSTQSCCAGTCYDPSVYGCSSSSNGTGQFLCPAPVSGRQSSFWLGNIKHEGTAAFLGDSSYVVYRNVRDYGAKGDGVTDDTSAINSAITAYGRCGLGCDSTTTRPAVVYFPAGTYVISSPIIQYYYTQLIGDATNLPVIVAAATFSGMAMVDSDPYGSNGNWYTNQNNFYRQVRNFIFDTTRTPDSKGTTCIHWQVAQATSLTNIVFKMSTNSGNSHQGIWMENGSGGFISDLIFYGGATAMWVGNQQFTSRNISIYNSRTGVYMNWNWGWTFKTLYIQGAKVAFDMSSVGDKGQQLVASVVILDAQIVDSTVGVKVGTGSSTSAATSCSLLLDNVNFQNVNTAVVASSGNVLIAGSTGSVYVPTWGQGHIYNSGNQGQGYAGYLTQAKRPQVLTDSDSATNYYFERPRPQYEGYDVSSFVSVKSEGAFGDGIHDDTTAIQTALYKYAGCRIIYFPAGTYVLSDTVIVPVGSRVVGEAWSSLMAKGQAFQDAQNPRPMLQVGNSGDVGVVELSDLLFTASGPQPGAILVQWNVKDPVDQPGSAGMWDCHFRVGGAAGTNQQINTCRKFSQLTPECVGTFMLMHLTATSSAYLENVWMWTADHDLDAFGADMSGQISIYNGRGLLVESTAGVWLYGTAVEHNVFYQYQLDGAENVFMAMIQTETPYFQAAPASPTPWGVNQIYNDPDFTDCPAGSSSCGMAWGMRYLDVNSVYLYGAGHYNFFQNYNQTCLTTEDCQDVMVDVQTDNTSELYLYGLNTKATVGMVKTYDNVMAMASNHVNTFCSTIHYLSNAQ